MCSVESNKMLRIQPPSLLNCFANDALFQLDSSILRSNKVDNVLWCTVTCFWFSSNRLVCLKSQASSVFRQQNSIHSVQDHQSFGARQTCVHFTMSLSLNRPRLRCGDKQDCCKFTAEGNSERYYENRSAFAMPK